MNAVRHKDSGKAEWGERDVVPLSPAVRKANRRNKVVPRACPPLFWRACPWGSTCRIAFPHELEFLFEAKEIGVWFAFSSFFIAMSMK